MELSKEQIEFIDHRLENDGIKYWDIRIELLDHVVSDIEKRMKVENSENDFKEMVQEVFVYVGWKENFNGSSFEDLNKEGWKNVNKGYRKMYYQRFLDFFKNPVHLLFLAVSFAGFYFLSEFLIHKTFLKVSYGVFISPTLLYFYAYFKTWRKKTWKICTQRCCLFLFDTLLFFSCAIMNFIRVGQDFSLPMEYHKPLLFLIIPLHLILTYSGYEIYKKAITKLDKMRAELW